MDIEMVRDYVLSLPGVTEDQPFGDDNITFRVEGKIFLCLWLGDNRRGVSDGALRFACKLLPERNEELRDMYEAVTPAFHWNKKHWSDVYFELLETELVTMVIEESYRLIVSKLPKCVRVKYEDDKNACLDVLHFELPAHNEANYILTHNRESLSVKLVESRPEYHGICETMDNKLHITSIYQEHKDIVEEAIWKRYAYNRKNIEALKASFAGTKLNLTDENVKRFVLGTYSESKDIHKRPLSRLMQDIHKII